MLSVTPPTDADPLGKELPLAADVRTVAAGGQDDLVVDFGSAGLWALKNNASWQQIHPYNPVSVTAGDLDGNGQSDLVVDFGSGVGLFIYFNDAQWTRLHSYTAQRVITADLNGDAQDEVLVDFGPSCGLWEYYAANNTWRQLTPLCPQDLVTGDFDGNGAQDLAADLGAYGLYLFRNDTAWQLLHSYDPHRLATGQLDAGSPSELIVDFGSGAGTWIYANGSAWQRLHTYSTAGIVTGNLDGVAGDETVIDFGAGVGVWEYYAAGGSWRRLAEVPAEQMVTGDLDGNGRQELIGDLGSYGLFSFANDTAWTCYHRYNPEMLAVAELDARPAGDAYEADDTAAQAQTITTDGAPQTHSLHAGTDTDWVKFTLTQTSTVVIETDGPTSSDTLLYLYGPDDSATLLASDDDSGNGYYSLIDAGVLGAGTYYVKVAEYGADDAIDEYYLCVTTSPVAPPPPPTESGAAWTFLVYLDADNNLESCGLDDFAEMAQVNNPNVNIVVQFDRGGYSSAQGGWTSVKRFLVTQGQTPTAAQALADLGELNMGDPNTLRDFITWGRATYPAQHYALVLWNHGGGWKSGICSDDTSAGDTLSMSDLHSALAAGVGETPLDIIGMDACLMAGLETAYEIKDYAHYFVASAETEPGDGWEYQDILAASHLTSTTTADAWAQYMVTAYQTRYDSWNSDCTLGAFDLTQIGVLSTRVSALATQLLAGADPSSVTAARTAARYYSDVTYVDLYDFCNGLTSRTANTALRAAAQQVKDVFDGGFLRSYWKDSAYSGNTTGQRCFSIYLTQKTGSTVDGGVSHYTSAYLSFLADGNQHWDEWIAQANPRSLTSGAAAVAGSDSTRQRAAAAAFAATYAHGGQSPYDSLTESLVNDSPWSPTGQRRPGNSTDRALDSEERWF